MKPSLRVEAVGVLGVQQPLALPQLAALDHLADELEPHAAPAVGLEHVDVGEVDERRAVRDRTAEADLAAVVEE